MLLNMNMCDPHHSTDTTAPRDRTTTVRIIVTTTVAGQMGTSVQFSATRIRMRVELCKIRELIN